METNQPDNNQKSGQSSKPNPDDKKSGTSSTNKPGDTTRSNPEKRSA